MKKFTKGKKFTKTVVASAAVAAALLGGTAVAAHAATTFTPTGSTANFVGSSVSFRDIEANQTLTCTTFDLAGSIISSGVSRAYGVNAGSLSNLTSSGCTNVLAGPTTVTPTGTWGVTVTGDPTGTTFPARLTNVAASLSAVNCNFTVAGVVNGSFDTATQKFTPVTGASGLTLDSVPPGQAMCVTLDLQVGDTVEVGGTWTNTGPALNIANP